MSAATLHNNQKMANLIFIPRTQVDANQFNQSIDGSDFYAEWDTIEGFFTFEEDDDTIDELERQLQDLCNVNEINGHFECY
jgi:hypothetical protein